MNIGKVFETEFKSSIPENCFYYRFNDGTSSFGGNDKVRFQAKNICDCMVMSSKGILYLLELKNTLGTSLPISNLKINQINGLAEINHKFIKAYFVICFRNKEKCFMVDAKKIKEFIDLGVRKSIPINWCEENGIKIEMIKKRVRYKYNLNDVI